MNRLETYRDFLTTQSVQVPVVAFVAHLLGAAVLAMALAWVYTKYGHSLSNRKKFAKNF